MLYAINIAIILSDYFIEVGCGCYIIPDNLSFFAFTATPKSKTLQVFGNQCEDGKFRPFHIYSMRQAIEEGFIHDVLLNYTTYKQYYKIAKKL